MSQYPSEAVAVGGDQVRLWYFFAIPFSLLARMLLLLLLPLLFLLILLVIYMKPNAISDNYYDRISLEE